MMDKEKADQQASPKEIRIHDISGHAQRARLLARLELGPVDTLTARAELNILMPAARIKELKDMGHNIRSHRISRTDEQGHTHRGISLYYLATKTPSGQE